ncbi:MAG: right-handed parallel beta-helix repeat-containing protein [Lentisphaeria bacterium]|nr:right-handed parallel beta-helix repeat-containing protein [Lentisphaeria bacterium]
MDPQTHPPFATMRPIREPKRITVRVGAADADFAGMDDKAIQAALDYVRRLGGGTVQLAPGVYSMRNALFPHAGVTLRGSGSDTILRKTSGATTTLVREADWFEYCVQVEEPGPFCVGGGLALTSGKAEWPQTKLFTITVIDGNVLYLDQRTEKNFYMCEDAVAQSAHSLIHGLEVHDFAVEDLVLDGNAAENPKMNGNYCACVFMQYCDRWSFRNVTARDFHGDGFSFQVCDDIHFENCQALDNATLGFHPGSGSQRPLFRDCTARGNDQGLFWCWGVCDGLAENCTLSGNRKYGSSIGHRDTDNVMRACVFEANGDVGVIFRQEVNEGRTPDRNTLDDCLFRDNENFGVDIQWATRDAVIRGCKFESSDGRKQSTAIRIAAEAQGVKLADNQFVNCKVEHVETEAQ